MTGMPAPAQGESEGLIERLSGSSRKNADGSVTVFPHPLADEARNEIIQLCARAEAAERERDEARATVSAWESAFGTIEAHIKDRIAMGDDAKPGTYLSIMQNCVGNLPRDSKQIYAATQSYGNSMSAYTESLSARVAELEGALTPSAATKAAYIGEFKFKVDSHRYDEDEDEMVECTDTVTVPWATIKEIMAAIRARALSKGGQEG